MQNSIFISLMGRSGGIMRIRADLVLSIMDEGSYRAVVIQRGNSSRSFFIQNKPEDIENKIRDAWPTPSLRSQAPVFIDIGGNNRIKPEHVCAVWLPRGENLTDVCVPWSDNSLKTPKLPEDIEKLVNAALRGPLLRPSAVRPPPLP